VAKQKGSGFFLGTKMYPTTIEKYEKSITVNAPVEEVATILEDVSKSAEWMGGLRELRLLAGNPHDIGAKMYWKSDVLGYIFEGTSEVTKHIHGKEYEIKNTEKRLNITSIDRFVLNERGDKTKVTWTLKTNIPDNVRPVLKLLHVKRENVMPFLEKRAIKFFANVWQTTSLNRLRRLAERN
jgi:uncharacterized membrane protein